MAKEKWKPKYPRYKPNGDECHIQKGEEEGCVECGTFGIAPYYGEDEDLCSQCYIRQLKTALQCMTDWV